MENTDLIQIYKNKIEELFKIRYNNINSIPEIGYVGKTFDELKNHKPTEEDLKEFRKLTEREENSNEYKILYRKLSIWRLLDSCVDDENNSIADLIEKIKYLQNEENINKNVNENNDTVDKVENKHILFFDTETTGLPKNYKLHYTETDNWPRLVQLAYILCDSNGKIIDKGSWIVKPIDFIIPSEASNIHRITNEKAQMEGLSINIILNNFKSILNQSDILVAHNISYDVNIIGAELTRLNIKSNLDSIKKICTMEKSTNFCAIEGHYGYKWPKLSELFIKLFNTNFEEAHDAEVDIEATYKCFWELVNKKILTYE